MSAHPPGQWVTQQEAAGNLGISTEAVRMRVRRGSLESRKDDHGRVVVWVVSNRTESAQATGQSTEELTEALKARIESLERSLEHERESSRRKDTIIMQMAQRIPELEASPEQTSETSHPAQRSEEPPQPPPDEEQNSRGGEKLTSRLRRWLQGS